MHIRPTIKKARYLYREQIRLSDKLSYLTQLANILLQLVQCQPELGIDDQARALYHLLLIKTKHHHAQGPAQNTKQEQGPEKHSD